MSSDTLGNITKLQYISMSHCKKIEVLPPQIIHQRYLTELSVDDTILKELPSAIAELRNLERLELGGPLLETLPVCLGRLSSLKHLRIRSSEQLKHLPDSIRKLTGLETFSIDGTGLEFIPPCIMALNNLRSLSVKLGGSFRELPFKSLGGESETVTDSTRVRVLSRPDVSIECLRDLQSLTLHDIKISEVAFCKGVCPNLQSVFINHCDMVEIGTLPYSLRKLDLYRCPNLKKIEGLCGLENLQTLRLNVCGEEELSGHATLKSLETLEVWQCEKLKGILGLQHLTKLRVLDVSMCVALEELQGIEHLMSLVMLHVDSHPNLQWVEGVQWGEGVLKHLLQREEEGILELRKSQIIHYPSLSHETLV